MEARDDGADIDLHCRDRDAVNIGGEGREGILGEIDRVTARNPKNSPYDCTRAQVD